MDEELLYQVKKMIVDTLHIDGMSILDIDTDAPLFGEGLDLDPVDARQLVLGMQHAFGVAVPDAAVGSKVFRSVRSIAEYIELHG